MIVASTEAGFGLAEVKRNLVAAGGGLLPAAPQGHRQERRHRGRPHRRAPLPPSGPTSSAWSTRSPRPGEALAGAMELAEKIAANAPLAVWASRQLVIDADWDDEATIKKNTGEAFMKHPLDRGHQGGPHRLHREARPRVEGPLTLPRLSVAHVRQVMPDQVSHGGREP